MLRVTVLWVVSAAALFCAVGTRMLGWVGVLDSALLLPPGLWLQVNGKWHSQEGSAEQLPLRGGKGRLSQFLPECWDWGRGSCEVMQAGSGKSGCWECNGSPWPHVGKHKGSPVPPSLPRVCWLPPRATRAPVSWRCPSDSLGRRCVLQHRGLGCLQLLTGS